MILCMHALMFLYLFFRENNEPNPHTSSEPVKNVFKDETKPKFVKRGKRKRRLVENAAPSKVSKVQFKIPKVMEKKNHVGETRLQVECKKVGTLINI